MSPAIALSDEQWELVGDLFDPPGRRGAPADLARRQMVEAMLFNARTGCRWRCLPERYGAWSAVCGPSGGAGAPTEVWARAMLHLATVVRILHDRAAALDRDGRRAEREGWPLRPLLPRYRRSRRSAFGTKRSLLVEILGLPIAGRAASARPHDVTAGRELLRAHLDELPRLRAIVGDRTYRGLTSIAERKRIALDVKAHRRKGAASPRCGGYNSSRSSRRSCSTDGALYSPLDITSSRMSTRWIRASRSRFRRSASAAPVSSRTWR